MAGRPAKPIDLHIVSGNPSHLTKAEIEHRKKIRNTSRRTETSMPGLCKI